MSSTNPQLFQELEDVYHDVSGVVLDSLTEGSSTIAQKVKVTLQWNYSYFELKSKQKIFHGDLNSAGTDH